jgi:hypothetical protein
MAKSIMEYISPSNIISSNPDSDGYVEFRVDVSPEFWVKFTEYGVVGEDVYSGDEKIYPCVYIDVDPSLGVNLVRLEYGDFDNNDGDACKTYILSKDEASPWIEEAEKDFVRTYNKPYDFKLYVNFK